MKAWRLLAASVLLGSTTCAVAQENPVVTTFGQPSTGGAALYAQNAYPGYGGGYQMPGYPVYGMQYPGFPPAMIPPSVTDAQQTLGVPQGRIATEQGTTFGPAPTNVIDMSPPTTNDRPAIDLGDAATAGNYAGGTYTLSDITNPDSGFYTGRQIMRSSNVRTNQIIAAAEGVGIKAGFAAEAQRLAQAVNRHAASMDAHFNFAALMTGGGFVVPPVISEVRAVSEQRNPTVVYSTTGIFEIASEAYVSVRPPHWRDYLTVNAAAPSAPSGIKIETSDDRRAWRDAAKRGWDRGVSEARAAFTAGLDRLVRDHKGMLRYHELAGEGAVSLAKTSVTEKNGAVYVNGKRATGRETVIRLTVQPRFKSPAAIARTLEKTASTDASASNPSVSAQPQASSAPQPRASAAKSPDAASTPATAPASSGAKPSSVAAPAARTAAPALPKNLVPHYVPEPETRSLKKTAAVPEKTPQKPTMKPGTVERSTLAPLLPAVAQVDAGY